MSKKDGRIVISDNLRSYVAEAVGDAASSRFTVNVKTLADMSSPELRLDPEMRQVFDREVERKGGDRLAALLEIMNAGCRVVRRDQARDRGGIELESLEDFELETLTDAEVKGTNGVVEERIKRMAYRLISWNDQQPDSSTRIRISAGFITKLRLRLSEDFPVLSIFNPGRVLDWFGSDAAPDFDQLNEDWGLSSRHNASLGKGKSITLGVQAFQGLTQALTEREREQAGG